MLYEQRSFCNYSEIINLWEKSLDNLKDSEMKAKVQVFKNKWQILIFYFIVSLVEKTWNKLLIFATSCKVIS